MKPLVDQIRDITKDRIFGHVTTVKGLLIEIAGPIQAMPLGAIIEITTIHKSKIIAEVIGFSENRALLMPFDQLNGVMRGCKAELVSYNASIKPHESWLGRVLNAVGQPIDNGPALIEGFMPCDLKNAPPPAHARQRLGSPLDMGVRVLNTFLTCREGQRLGIFAGSGVGKSVLLSMLARYAKCDIAIIGLVGERGREVQEFLQDDLGEDGLKKSIIVVATSDEPALMRRQAAYTTLALAEYFRDEGKNVLLLMDSVTRFAMAQREIGLSAGEPPTSKGYTPTVFTELPSLLERAGPGLPKQGHITGIFTVLVDGDDHNEPVADAVRGILDGHIVMERAIAERGRYPAVNVLKSVSRTMPSSANPDYLSDIQKARSILATYNDMEELIRLGAYRSGTSAEVDEAILLQPKLDAFLSQGKDDSNSFIEGYTMLRNILSNS